MKPRRPSITVQIWIALLAGILVGWAFPALGRGLHILGDIFLRLILVIIAPLIFSTLVVGIAQGAGLKKVGGMAWRAAVFFIVLTGLALAFGMLVGNWFHPGRGIPEFPEGTTFPLAAPRADAPLLVRIFPTSIADAMARGDVLQIVVFSTLFALALGAIGERGKPVYAFCLSLNRVVFKLTDYVMYFAPLGVFGFVSASVAEHGFGALKKYVLLVLVCILGFTVIFFGGYSLLARIFGLSFGKLLRHLGQALSVAFATRSGAAALPKAIEGLERYGVSAEIAGFVLPLGLSFNLIGSAFFVGLAAVFVAQAYGTPLSLARQVEMLPVLLLASKSIPSVPYGSLIALAAGLSALQLPLQPLGVLFAIDPIQDMARTLTNTLGNCVTAAAVWKWERKAQRPAEGPAEAV